MCWAPSLLEVNSALCCNYRPQSKQSMRFSRTISFTEGKPCLKTSLILPNSHTIKCRFFFMSFATFLQLFSRLYPSHFSLFVFIFCSHNFWKMNSLRCYFLLFFFLIWYLLEDTESLLYHSHFVWKTLKNINGQTMLSLYIFTHWKVTMMKKSAFFIKNRWIKCRSFVILFAHLSW